MREQFKSGKASENIHMNQYPAQGNTTSQQPVDALGNGDGSSSQAAAKPSPFKKFLPFIIIFFVLLILSSALLLVRGNRTSNQVVVPTPTIRPTATPFPAPTIPIVSAAPTSVSVQVSPAKVGRLAFIKDGDIYHSDLASITLLVKNTTPAADRLAWSPLGNFLSWRPKLVTATPSALVVYNRNNGTSVTVNVNTKGTEELIDYVWSPDEKQIALVVQNASSTLSLVSSQSQWSEMKPLDTKGATIKQVLWPDVNTILFSTTDGIYQTSAASASSRIIQDQNIVWMKTSPDKKKIVYSIGTREKGDLYLVNVDGTNKHKLPSVPGQINMGTTGLDQSVLQNGLLPFAVWFPKSDKLMVVYNYLPQLPLVGIYDLLQNSFTAITPFTLYASDIMVDDLRLLGARVKTIGGVSSWQLSLFTIEDNAKLSSIRVIPEASSPAFFDLYMQD